MAIIRTKTQLENIALYKCDVKAHSANKRFDDKISKTDVLDVLERYNYRCFYCNQEIKKDHWQLDHFHPRANGGKNLFDNLVCTCNWCNTMKNALDGFAFLSKCKTIINNNWIYKNNVNYEITDKMATRRQRRYFNKAYDFLNEKLKDKNIDPEVMEIIYESLSVATNRNWQAIKQNKK